MKVLKKLEQFSGIINAILFASAAALLLYLARYIATGSVQFSFMAWNLVLSLLALLASVLYVATTTYKHTSVQWIFFALWVAMLPNTFYMLTDFVHVKETGDITLLFDIVLVGLFAMNGYVHGLLSLFLVHKTLLKKYKKIYVHATMLVIIAASSFAVDMGRYLRWNSWDVLLNPKALLFDVAETILSPTQYDRSFLITSVFFVSILSLYAVVWNVASFIDKNKKMLV